MTDRLEMSERVIEMFVSAHVYPLDAAAILAMVAGAILATQPNPRSAHAQFIEALATTLNCMLAPDDAADVVTQQ